MLVGAEQSMYRCPLKQLHDKRCNFESRQLTKYCWVASGKNLEGLISANGSDQSICTRNCRDNILSHSQRQHFSHTLNLELPCTLTSLLKHPLHVFEIVIVSNFIFTLLLPKNFQCILDAVLRSSWSIGNCAIVSLGFLSKAIQQGTLIARRVIGINEKRLTLKSFSSSINVVASGLFSQLIDLKDNVIKIFACLDIVKTTDNDREFEVLTEGDVLNPLKMCRNFDTWASPAYKRGDCISFMLVHVFLPEHKLPVEISEIYSVHINQVNISCSTQGQVFHNFTSQPSCSDNHNWGFKNGFVVEGAFPPIFLKGSFIVEQWCQIGKQFIQRLRLQSAFHARINYIYH